MTYRNGRFSASRSEDGRYDIFGQANYRPGNAPGSGSVFCLAHARTEAGARYQVDCYSGAKSFSMTEFAAIEADD